MKDIQFVILPLKMRSIDKLVGQKAEITTNDGRKLSGYGDCIVPLNVDTADEDSEEDDYLRFVTANKESEYLRENDIASYRLIT